jgi:hypothetical protein
MSAGARPSSGSGVKVGRFVFTQYKEAWPETYASKPDIHASILFPLEFRLELSRPAFPAS